MCGSSVYVRHPHGWCTAYFLSKMICPTLSIKCIVGQVLSFPHMPKTGEHHPEHGGETDEQRIQRPEQQGLHCMPVFMYQKPLVVCITFRNEQEHSNRCTVAHIPTAYHSPMEYVVVPMRMTEKYYRPHKRLQAAPCALQQNKKTTFHKNPFCQKSTYRNDFRVCAFCKMERMTETLWADDQSAVVSIYITTQKQKYWIF